MKEQIEEMERVMAESTNPKHTPTFTNTIELKHKALTDCPPTRRCLVCECKENQDAVFVDANKAWLCDNCRTVLLEIVESKSTGMRANRLRERK